MGRDPRPAELAELAGLAELAELAGLARRMSVRGGVQIELSTGQARYRGYRSYRGYRR